MFLKELNFKSNILYNETHLMVSMNKALFIVGFLAIVFAGAFMNQHQCCTGRRKMS